MGRGGSSPPDSDSDADVALLTWQAWQSTCTSYRVAWVKEGEEKGCPVFYIITLLLSVRVSVPLSGEKGGKDEERGWDGMGWDEVFFSSRMKMVHQVLAGTHVALAGEAMGLAAGAGLDTKQVFEIITNAAGNSW